MVIQVLLVDDEELVRTGLRLILESQPDITVVAEAGDGLAAVSLAGQHQPDVVLMDVRMPLLDGIAATAEVLLASPRSKVIMLTTFDKDEHVFNSLRAGAGGFLLKDSPRTDLIRAVREVMAGRSLLSPGATRQLISEYVRTAPTRTHAAPPELAVLSEREREVLAHVARGLTNAEIAATLTLSEHTVKTHVGNILAKLHLRDRVQAVIFAYETGVGTGTTG
ncbi:response regulator transcription factor [Streptomyces sp. Go-475]|uniref:response regulator n=1 Tax=Streptomyces sp. Go-475 TaxID=2072505 RepID=UPI000DEFE947|nr:response regulator transcription factor [Streptomyces sp. Go-475]AXE83355.1 Transcriptional regulatory protein DegU [Streptomyces sp. Go-475]AXE90921.1 Transcriptional regulatory protein DegU [Streptomyces sp. Go-475]